MFPNKLKIVLAVSMLGFGCNTLNPEKSAELGQHYLDHHDWARAAAEARPIVDAQPGYWKTQYVYGVAMTHLGDLAAAGRALERAYDAQPRNTTVVFAYAEVLFQANEASALYQVLRGAGADLHSAKAYVKLAEYAEKLNDLDSAVMALSAAIEVDDGFSGPMSSDAYYYLSVVQAKLGNADASTRRLRQAYGISPTDPRVLDALRAAGVSPDPSVALPPGA